jgi:Family of unknown function (DUF6496)
MRTGSEYWNSQKVNCGLRLDGVEVRVPRRSGRIRLISRRGHGTQLTIASRPAEGCIGGTMPQQKTKERARRAARRGKAPTTQAGEFVREEIEHVRQGKHGARSPKQVIAIGLSKARRAGVKLPPPPKGRTSEKTRRSAERAYERGQSGTGTRHSARRSRAASAALKREGRQAASRSALSRQARSSRRKAA